MHLLRLPAELLHQIICDVGTRFFREDVRRLTVCKSWYASAYEVFWADVVLSARSLSRLVDGSSADRLKTLHQRTKRLTIWLDEDNTWDMGELPPELLDMRRAPEGAPWRQDKRQKWVDALNRDLWALINLALDDAKAPPHVEHFHFTALSDWEPFRCEDYLFSNTMAQLLCSPGMFSTLASLELDTSGTAFMPHFVGSAADEPHLYYVHVCEAVSELLPRLVRLRLRMAQICPAALCLPHDCSPTRLKDVAVKLSYSDQLPASRNGRLSEPCRLGMTESTMSSLRVDMESQASHLAQLMQHPKTVRVLRHIRLPHLLQSLDVLTGRRMMVSDDMEWDEDGEDVCDDWENLDEPSL